MKKGIDLLHTISRRCLSLTLLPRQTTAPHSHFQMDPSERYRYNPTLRWTPEVEEYFIHAYGADHFSCISKALTCPSCYSCIRVNALKSTSDAVIQKLFTALKESNIPQTSDKCTSESLQLSENADSLNAILQTGSISKCQLPGLDYVVFVNGSGPHNIEYGYEQDRPPKEVVVSRKCAEAVLRGAQVFVPGVLACSGHVEEGDVVAVAVAVEQPGPDGGWGIGITRGTVLQGLQKDPHYFIRNGMYIGQGRAMMSRAGLFRVSEGVAVDMNNRVFKLPSFHGVLKGEIFLQNLPSIITAHALGPREGERILDMCAAPGGKTTAIAMLMKDKGEVVAVDRSHNKVIDIQNLAAEMGLTCITTYKLDALKAVRQRRESNNMNRQCPDYSLGRQMEEMPSISTEALDDDRLCEESTVAGPATQRTYTSKADLRKSFRQMKNGPGRNHSAGGRVEKTEGFSTNSFDRVLLDAPCSALGLRPRLFAGEVTVQSLRNHAKYQKKLFDQAVQLVRPGGVLVYSTCTINPGENEALVRYVLDTYKFLSLGSQHPKVGGPGLFGGCTLSDGYTEEWLRAGEEDMVQRFDPSSKLDTIGFFIAKFDVGPKDA